MSPRELLLGSFNAAVAAADPLAIVPQHLPKPPKGRTLVVGAGKAAASMALAVEQHWPADAPLDGTVITRYAHGLLTNRITVVEAGHPVPDEAGAAAAKRILDSARRLSRDDLLLALISGGGSSLLSLPVETITMADLKAVTQELLRCGATIQEINTVRKHLSAIQGGRLAAACKAKILALVISDVTGDDPTHVASGPCAPDPTTYQDALAILERYECKIPKAVQETLVRGVRGELAETPKPGDKVFAKTENRVIATAHQSLAAAAKFFEANGVRAAILGDSVTGEAREVAKVYAALAREVKAHGQPWQPPVALISGGECTVTVRGNGRGGRCAEFLLSLVNELQGADGIHALACDTDGIDGTENNAGAIAAPEAYARAAKLGLRADQLLENNDGYGYFSALGDLVVTGPTRTNVNDYRAILVSA
ncbi:MAG: hydroxypyruvate reductase [Betaproteobacteria bacterium RIFCSPLOWO2_12_FULL_62_13b]|nr:MAG: hydroxypyruvate reductase [Betaproteobacteria bacterium RIFCSPLOWO2_12_FULL_62_13b]